MRTKPKNRDCTAISPAKSQDDSSAALTELLTTNATIQTSFMMLVFIDLAQLVQATFHEVSVGQVNIEVVGVINEICLFIGLDIRHR